MCNYSGLLSLKINKQMNSQNQLLKQLKYSIRSYSIRKDKKKAWYLFKKIENLIKFHSFNRLKNLFKYMYLKQNIKISKMKLSKGINNGVFYLLVDNRDEKNKKVVKIPRFNNISSCRLLNLTRGHEKFGEEYQKEMIGLTKDSNLGKHLPKIFDIKKDGSYISSFIEGFNLKDVKQQIIYGGLKTDINPLKDATNELWNNIKSYRDKTGKIVGDWGIHNLLFNPVSDRLYNVDLEGFCLYNNTAVENSYEYVSAELCSLLSLISIAEDENELLDLFRIIEDKVIELKSFSGTSFFTGFQSVKIKNYFFNGRKNCERFIKSLPVDFKDKRVLDIGSFWGSVLSELSPMIEAGFGIEKDDDCIKISGMLAGSNQKKNIHFYKFDLEKLYLSDVIKNINAGRLDIIFILDVLNELSNPQKLIKESSSEADQVIFEITGSELLRKKQSELISKYFKQIRKIDYSNEEWWFNKNSEVLICSN